VGGGDGDGGSGRAASSVVVECIHLIRLYTVYLVSLSLLYIVESIQFTGHLYNSSIQPSRWPPPDLRRYWGNITWSTNILKNINSTRLVQMQQCKTVWFSVTVVTVVFVVCVPARVCVCVCLSMCFSLY